MFCPFQPLFPIIQRACLPYLVFASLLTVFLQKPFKNSRICLFLGFFGPLGQLLSFLGHQNYLFSKNIYVIVFYHIRALIWCATHAYSAYLKNYPKWGALGFLKNGGKSRFQLYPPSNNVSHHPKSIFANFDVCIATCRFLQEVFKNLRICLFLSFFGSLGQLLSFLGHQNHLFSKKYICNSILPHQSSHLMCNTCIFCIF